MYALETTLHRLSVRRLHAEFYIRPDRRAAGCALGKGPRDDSGFYFAQYRRFADIARSRRLVIADNAGRSGGLLKHANALRVRILTPALAHAPSRRLVLKSKIKSKSMNTSKRRGFTCQ